MSLGSIITCSEVNVHGQTIEWSINQRESKMLEFAENLTMYNGL